MILSEKSFYHSMLQTEMDTADIIPKNPILNNHSAQAFIDSNSSRQNFYNDEPNGLDINYVTLSEKMKIDTRNNDYYNNLVYDTERTDSEISPTNNSNNLKSPFQTNEYKFMNEINQRVVDERSLHDDDHRYNNIHDGDYSSTTETRVVSPSLSDTTDSSGVIFMDTNTRSRLSSRDFFDTRSSSFPTPSINNNNNNNNNISNHNNEDQNPNYNYNIATEVDDDNNNNNAHDNDVNTEPKERRSSLRSDWSSLSIEFHKKKDQEQESEEGMSKSAQMEVNNTYDTPDVINNNSNKANQQGGINNNDTTIIEKSSYYNQNNNYNHSEKSPLESPFINKNQSSSSSISTELSEQPNTMLSSKTNNTSPPALATPITVLTGFKGSSFSLLKYLSSPLATTTTTHTTATASSSSSSSSSLNTSNCRVCVIGRNLKPQKFSNGNASLPLDSDFTTAFRTLWVPPSSSQSSTTATSTADNNNNSNNINMKSATTSNSYQPFSSSSHYTSFPYTSTTTTSTGFNRLDFDAVFLDLTGVNVNIGTIIHTLNMNNKINSTSKNNHHNNSNYNNSEENVDISSQFYLDHVLCLYELNPQSPGGNKSKIYLLDELIAISNELIILTTNAKEYAIKNLMQCISYDALSINRYLKITSQHPKFYYISDFIQQRSMDLDEIGMSLGYDDYMSVLDNPLPVPRSIARATTSIGVLFLVPEISTLGVTISGDVDILKFSKHMSAFLRHHLEHILQCYGVLAVKESVQGSSDKFVFRNIKKQFTLLRSKYSFDPNVTNDSTKSNSIDIKNNSNNCKIASAKETNSNVKTTARCSKLVFVCKQPQLNVHALVSCLKLCLVNPHTHIQIHSS